MDSMKPKYNWDTLEKYLPENTLKPLVSIMEDHVIRLSIVRGRKSKLGDYRLPSPKRKFHQISINGNLDPRQFLVTLIHELAHLYAFDKYGRRIKPHGKEWKQTYVDLLMKFLPFTTGELRDLLLDHIAKPRATTNAKDDEMLHHEKLEQGNTFVKDIQSGNFFTTEKGQKFQMIKRLRTYYLCKDADNKRMYRVHGLMVVSPK
ncbi:MAG: SprT-like domain-containing protein [Cryomorphaceae bacterium]|nr:SprT-like domain-containing protein [Cryomorphaceae bacterium]